MYSHSKKKNYNIMIIITFLIGTLLIFSTYAWFYASLNVKVKFFNMVVSNNSGLTISFDGINFGSSVEISEDMLINKLKQTYPNNISQWASLGLTPVSSNGISNKNNPKFDMYYAINYGYKDKARTKRYLSTKIINENRINSMNDFIAFDLFLKNVTGSPINDNLYLDMGTDIKVDARNTNDIESLVNSMRFGFVKIGSTSLESTPNEIQNVNCNNKCEMIIYEPHSSNHNQLSISKAENYGINLMDGVYYPTFAAIKEAKEVDVDDAIKGRLQNQFSLQITRFDYTKPLFQIPDGITKVRVYVWIEGQDIDSLDSYSNGADISITINLRKDTAGYDYYNE